MEEENQKKNPVLILAGIDKKWVRSESGKWVDEATLFVEKTINDDSSLETLEGSQPSKKRWWKFW
ncbi:MAG TPA: hypothetical protein EYG86_00340 [Crocinitomicaceae bacterium]|nr:hypothetical protein [Crocinitomicaceae bacterium]